jgi:hypothetical protein
VEVEMSGLYFFFNQYNCVLPYFSYLIWVEVEMSGLYFFFNQYNCALPYFTYLIWVEVEVSGITYISFLPNTSALYLILAT